MFVEPATGGTERLGTPARLIAAREIAAAERDWSAARALLEHPSLTLLSTEQRMTRLAVQQALYHIIELQGVNTEDADVVLEIFAENPEAVNATLGRIEMNGNWSAADPFERLLLGYVYDAGYQSIARLGRETEDAKRAVKIPAGLTAQHGYVALARNRRLIVGSQPDGRRAQRPHIEIDKVSTFALDIAQLAQLDDAAVAEVRLIVASTIYKAIDWDALRRAGGDVTPEEQFMLSGVYRNRQRKRRNQSDSANLGTRSAGSASGLFACDEDKIIREAREDLGNLLRIVERYDMSFEEINNRAFNVENPTAIRDPSALEFVEAALHERSELLTPAATTYYVH